MRWPRSAAAMLALFLALAAPTWDQAPLPAGQSTLPAGAVVTVSTADPPPVTGEPWPVTPLPLDGLRWQAIPGSEMNSVFRPGVDDATERPGAWAAVQDAWSGATCAGSELIVWGGGHKNGDHNGLFAVRPDGTWRRITEPSPVWQEEQCPDGMCPALTGPCRFGRCSTGPDGRPVSRHTYYLLGWHAPTQALYTVGGAIYPAGSAGDPPTAWRFREEVWEPLPEPPVSGAHGSLVIVGDTLYYSVSTSGMTTLDLTTLTWSPPRGFGAYGGHVGAVYVPGFDSIYFVGNGRFAWVPREQYGVAAPEPAPRGPGDEIVDDRYLGLTYSAADGVILAWNGGPTLHAIDPRTHTVTAHTLPGDDPGPPTKKGTFGRLGECDGQIMLVNGVDQPLYVLVPSDSSDPLPAEPQQPPVDPDPDDPPGPESPGSQPPGPLPPTALTDPYYPTPPGGSLEAFDAWVDAVVELPRDQWTVYEVGPGRQHASTSAVRVGKGERAIVRIHPSADGTAYPALNVKAARAAIVEGVPDAQGRTPRLEGVNMTRAFRDPAAIVRGGLVVRHLALTRSCIGFPGDSMFVAVEDSWIESCAGHGIISPGYAPHAYVRILRSHWRYASSHLVYIARVARADIIGNTCEAPGWGHCLRSVARVTVMRDNLVSNVHLDGTVPPLGVNPHVPNRRYVGMHPLDVYGCAHGDVRGNRVLYYREQAANAPMGIAFRTRRSHRHCEIGAPDGGGWQVLDPRSQAFFDPATWAALAATGDAARLVFTFRDNSVRVIGPGRDLPTGALFLNAGTYPVMHPDDIAQLQAWLRGWWAEQDQSRPLHELWAAMRAAMPHVWFGQVADLVFPSNSPRRSFMRGTLLNTLPLPVPVGHWYQRQVVRVGPHTLEVCEAGECAPSPHPILRPEESDWIYYGEPDPAAQFGGPTYRRAFVEIIP